MFCRIGKPWCRSARDRSVSVDAAANGVKTVFARLHPDHLRGTANHRRRTAIHPCRKLQEAVQPIAGFQGLLHHAGETAAAEIVCNGAAYAIPCRPFAQGEVPADRQTMPRAAFLSGPYITQRGSLRCPKDFRKVPIILNGAVSGRAFPLNWRTTPAGSADSSMRDSILKSDRWGFQSNFWDPA